MSDSESGSESVSDSESEQSQPNYGSEPSEDENSRPPPSKRAHTSSSNDEDLPMFMRLQQDGPSGGVGGKAEVRHTQRKLRKQKRDKLMLSVKPKEDRPKKSKNAPAEMPSNKPVRRLRDNVANTSEKKYRDPRFDELSGRLNIDKFYQNTKFLDEYQEEEIATLQKKMSKTKSVDTKSIVKEELVRSKQQLTERRRSQKVSDKFRAAKHTELEKVKKGKTPFYLKASAKKELALEARYDELKSTGKLQSFLNKKRKKNSNKDHRKIPRARGED